MQANENIKQQWLDNFYFTPNSIKAINTLFGFIFFNMFPDDIYFDKQYNHYILYITTIMFLGGSFCLLLQKRFINGLLIITPVYLFILLSFLKIYPFSNRCIIFLVPLLIIIILKNFDILDKNKIQKTITFILLTIISGAYIYYVPKYSDYRFLIKPDKELNSQIQRQIEFLKNINNDSIAIGDICFYCFDNPNVIFENQKGENKYFYISENGIRDEFKTFFTNKKTVYYGLSDNEEEKMFITDFMKKNGYKYVEMKNIENMQQYSYIKFEQEK